MNLPNLHKVKRIRQEYWSKGGMYKDLAKKYNVRIDVLKSIIDNKTYHDPDYRKIAPRIRVPDEVHNMVEEIRQKRYN